MKPDAKAFFKALQRNQDRPYQTKKPVREVIAEIGINHKRAWYLLGKWTGRWYDYGVSLDNGWLNEEGMAVKVDDL